jgi:hypothetical protein
MPTRAKLWAPELPAAEPRAVEPRLSDPRRDELAEKLAVLESRVAAARGLLAGEIDERADADDAPAYADARAMLLLEGACGKRYVLAPDADAPLGKLIPRFDEALLIVEAIDAWIVYHDARAALAAFETANDAYPFEPNDFERALLEIFPLFVCDAVPAHMRTSNAFRGEAAGKVEQVEGYLAIRDACDGRLYAYDDARDRERVVYAVASARTSLDGSVRRGIDDLRVHRIRENRARAFLVAYENGRLPESGDVRASRRAVAAYVDLDRMTQTLTDLQREGALVQLFDVPGKGETLATSDAAAREALRTDPDLAGDDAYCDAVFVAYVGIATAEDAYAAGFEDATQLRARIVADHKRAQAYIAPTQAVEIDALQAELDRRLGAYDEIDDDGALLAPTEERKRADVLMRGLAALEVTSLELRPEGDVSGLAERLHEITAVAARECAQVARCTVIAAPQASGSMRVRDAQTPFPAAEIADDPAIGANPASDAGPEVGR